MRNVVRRAALAAVKVLLEGVNGALFDGCDPEHMARPVGGGRVAERAAVDAEWARATSATTRRVFAEWVSGICDRAEADRQACAESGPVAEHPPEAWFPSLSLARWRELHDALSGADRGE